jgi:ABC-type multidrug transport system fused ATPase/permease subunit
MLFKTLRLFGIDLPTRIAEVRVDVEERFDLAKDSVEQTAQTAAILALLFFLAGVAALSAFGVGLVALYSWVSSNCGQFYGFAAVGAVLLFVAVVMLASAISKATSWSAERRNRVAAKKVELAQARTERIIAAKEAFQGPALPPPQTTSETTRPSDLIEPLGWALSKTIKLPTMGHPAMDELFARLQSSARGVVDETVEGLTRAVSYGDRPQLFAALGGAMFVGWFLARHNQRNINSRDVQ